ncbi:MAG: TIGR00341 family protein, partial [Verrucomicrobiota bacterium]|nr:TIGR00341 family protein [Verrucomicrobiota bacterium]
GTLPDRLLKEDGKVAVGIFHGGSPLSEKLRLRIRDWFKVKVPQLDRQSRVDLFESIESNAQWSFDFIALICFSTALASLGLMLDSSPVIIGAMLVAPLMTPILGAGLSLVQGNKTLMMDCLKSVLLGYFCALVMGVFLGFFGMVYGITDQILRRTEPDIPDLLIAFLSGMAAAYCFSRPKLVSALAGVAIAAALVPPIATAGIGIALGKAEIASGSTLLFATNVVFIILGASMTFVAVGVRGDSESAHGKIWVNRAMLALIIAGAILVIPLGSKLIEKLSSKITGHSETLPDLDKSQ